MALRMKILENKNSDRSACIIGGFSTLFASKRRTIRRVASSRRDTLRRVAVTWESMYSFFQSVNSVVGHHPKQFHCLLSAPPLTSNSRRKKARKAGDWTLTDIGRTWKAGHNVLLSGFNYFFFLFFWQSVPVIIYLKDHLDVRSAQLYLRR